MLFVLRVNFTGLCALVPNTNGKEARVLLVDGRYPPTGSGRNEHIATVRYRGIRYPLVRQDVEIALVNATSDPATLQILSCSSLGSEPLPGTDEERCPHWIAEMANVYAPDAADDCFATDATVRSSVLARVKLTAGHLTTSRMLEDIREFGKVRVIVWEYIDAHGNSIGANHDRAMAAEFSVLSLVDGDGIKVKTRAFGGTTWNESALLTPVGGEVVIDIENSCYCEDKAGPLEDFGWFYDLAAAYQDIYLPNNPGGGYTDTMCPPARFNAHAKA